MQTGGGAGHADFLIQAVFFHENKFWTIKKPLAFMTEARKGQKGHNREKFFFVFLAILGHSESFGKKTFFGLYGLQRPKRLAFPAQLSKLHHMSK